MPYPNEHSARLKDPDDFAADSFRRKADGTIYGKIKVPATIDVIWGKLKGKDAPDDQPIPQALRFPTKDWTASEAKAWLEENKIKYVSFEPAEEKSRTSPPPGIKIPQGFQHRSFPLRELRVEPAEDNQRKIVGYAAVFNVLSEPLWGFREKIRKGAFTKTIGEANIVALFNHNEDMILGRNKAGTLKLAEDDIGLAIEILPPETQSAKDLMISMERGDVSQMSFSFRVVREEWDHLPAEEIRTLVEVELRDVSLVVFPAYPQTIATVGVRSVFGIEMPKLADALGRLEAGTAVLSDRDLVGDVVGKISRCLPGDHACRRRELDAAMLPPDLARRRAELDAAMRAPGLRGMHKQLEELEREVLAASPDDEPVMSRPRRGHDRH